MPTGFLNPNDDARTTDTRPAEANTGVGLRKWFSAALRTRIRTQDLNRIIAQFRSVGDFFGVTDTEGDDDYLRKAIQAAAQERLTANRTYYVRTDGADTNDGLTDSAVGAFLTIQRAINAAGSINLNGFPVVIQVGDGTYTGAINRTQSFNGGTVTLRGNLVTPSNVNISTASTAITVTNSALRIEGIKISTTGGSAILCADYATLTMSGTIELGAASSRHFSFSRFSELIVNANYTVSGGSGIHYEITRNSKMALATNVTVTLSGTPNFTSTFLSLTRSSSANMGANNVFTGAATGRRFVIDDSSEYNSPAAPPADPDTLFPGSLAGSLAPGFDGKRRFRNMLMNADGRLQDGPSGLVADDTYGLHQRWYALTQTAGVTPSTLADVQDGMPFMMRVTQSNAAAQRYGYSQIVEGHNCKHLRGRQVTLSGMLRHSVAATVRYAVIEWNGAEDAPTSDVVNSWASAVFAAGSFFVAASFVIAGNSSKVLTANTMTPFSLTVDLSSTFNNLIVFVWTNAVTAQNATLDLTAQIENGIQPTRHETRPVNVEEQLCQRYYQKKTVQTENGSRHIPLVPMRAAPTVAASVGTVSAVTASGFELAHTAAVASAVTASAEL